MGEQLERPAPSSRAGSPFKRLRHLGNIFMILLCGLVATIEVVKAIRGEPPVEHPVANSDSFSSRMKMVIQGQLVKVDQVDPMQLSTAFGDSLRGHNCKWIVSCEDLPKDPHPRIHELETGSPPQRI